MLSCQAGFLVLFLLSFTRAYLNIEELKTINYGIDFVNEPVLTTEESPVGSVLLSTKHGQQYQCSFPDIQAEESREKQEEREAVETGIPDLLKPMENSPCLVHNKDWWSYEFCYGKHVRQFHIEDGKIGGEIVYLGIYDKDYKWDESEDESSGKDIHRLNRYHSQHFVNGSKCDLTGVLRKAEVRFQCEEGQGDYIARVDEPETCSYVMYVHTTKICHHPYLKPSISRKPVPITCSPRVNQEEYQIYLSQEEERKKEEQIEKEQAEWIKSMINSDKETRMKSLKEMALKKKSIDQNKNEESIKNDEETIGKGVNNGDNVDDNRELGDGESGDTDTQRQTDTNTDNAITSPAKEEDGIEEVDLDKVVDEAIGRLSGLFSEELKKLKQLQGEQEEDEDDDDDVADKKPGKTKEEVKMDFKMIKDPEELQKYIKEALGNKKKDKDTEDDEETTAVQVQQEDKLQTETDSGGDDSEDKDVVQEFDKGVGEVTENEEHREGIALHKENIRHAVSSQFDDIVNEAQEELAREGIGGEVNKDQTFKELAKTLGTLLNRLEKTEKELKDMDKNIAEAEKKEKELKEQIKQHKDEVEASEEEESEEEEELEESPDKTETETSTEITDKTKKDNVKFRVSTLKPGSKKQSSIKELPMSDSQKAKLEASVKKQLEKAGMETQGKNVQVKIVATGLFNEDDDSVHVLSDDDSNSFNKMIFSILGGSQEALKQEKKQVTMEENYKKVWGKSGKKSKSPDH